MKELALCHRDCSPIVIKDVNKNYLVEVRGWPMFQKLNVGLYKMKFTYMDDYRGWKVTFYKPKGSTPIVSYYVNSLEGSFMLESNSDLNGLIFRGVYKGSVVV